MVTIIIIFRKLIEEFCLHTLWYFASAAWRSDSNTDSNHALTTCPNSFLSAHFSTIPFANLFPYLSISVHTTQACFRRLCGAFASDSLGEIHTVCVKQKRQCNLKFSFRHCHLIGHLTSRFFCKPCFTKFLYISQPCQCLDVYNDAHFLCICNKLFFAKCWSKPSQLYLLVDAIQPCLWNVLSQIPSNCFAFTSHIFQSSE